MANVTVGCKLPHGLQLKLPNKDGSETVVVLKGANSGTIIGLDGRVIRGTCGYTPVDEAFITEWLKVYKDYVPVKQKLIFIQRNLGEAKAQAADQADQKTGFEPMDQNKLVNGITPADKPGAEKDE